MISSLLQEIPNALVYNNRKILQEERMKNVSERLLKTLAFENVENEGAVAETFFPWTLTIDRWRNEGLPKLFTSEYLFPQSEDRSRHYFNDLMTDPVYEYEQYLGLDGVRRMAFRIPFCCFEPKTLEETEEAVLRLDEDGWTRKYYKNRDLVQEVRPVVCEERDWEKLKQRVLEEEKKFCTEEKLREIYGKYTEKETRNSYSIRFRASGFFWTPRELMGVEEHLAAFYEMPELIHEINTFVLERYLFYFDRIFDLIQPEVLLFEEDLSGKNGPMISPDMFDEFVGAYYKKLIPFLKKKGVRNVFVDTDGDFRMLIPNFLDAGVDGFLPMDVNAGMDIVAVRKEYPQVKFIGGFNKLVIAEGKDAIDREFERLLPVIRQGGYVPGADHQVAPSTSLEDYRYYLKKMKEVMRQAGADR